MGIDPYSQNWIHQRKLDPASPHIDLRALPRIATEQHGGWMQLLQITADGDTLGQHSTIVQLQHRQLSERIFGYELSTLVSTLTHGHMYQWNRDAFFGHENAYPSRIR